MNIVLLMMGGSGTRFNADIPKQYVELENRPIFTYIVEGYQKLDIVDQIVIVSHRDWKEFVDRWVNWLGADKVVCITNGGNTRSESVKNGLNAMYWAGERDVILIHDATHPYIDPEGVREIISYVHECGGATLGQPQFDTMYMMEEGQYLEKVVPRQYIVSGASPEAFHYKTIRDIYNKASIEELDAMTSAGAIALAHNIKMKIIPSEVLNLKITYQHDMKLLKLLIHDYFPNARKCTSDNKPVFFFREAQ